MNNEKNVGSRRKKKESYVLFFSFTLGSFQQVHSGYTQSLNSECYFYACFHDYSKR